VGETLWDGHVNFFVQITMQEGIMDIQLMKFPLSNGSYGK
jgi:hypothetical protein